MPDNDDDENIEECNKKEPLDEESPDLLPAQEECGISDVQDTAQDLDNIVPSS